MAETISDLLVKVCGMYLASEIVSVVGAKEGTSVDPDPDQWCIIYSYFFVNYCSKYIFLLLLPIINKMILINVNTYLLICLKLNLCYILANMELSGPNDFIVYFRPVRNTYSNFANQLFKMFTI